MKRVADGEFLERHVATLLSRFDDRPDPTLACIVAALVRRTIDGHSASRLDDLIGTAGELDIDVAACRQRLRASRVVGAPGQVVPLILDDSDRLYLYRYWRYEQQVADALLRLATCQQTAVDAPRLRASLEQMFARADEAGQKTAAAVAALRRFAVISGGPGTGKTTTVLRLLALLLDIQPDARVALAAPTGKAAARVSQSIRAQLSELPGSSAREAIPEEAFTLHRLLGSRPGVASCRYDAANPLPYDIVVIDEASMIGLSMMARLLEALPEHARLVLLGDKDQLASVEPGAVLGDICADSDGFSSEFAARLASVGVEAQPGPACSQLQDCVVTLQHSYRFDASSGIGRLAHAIRNADADRAIDTLRDGQDSAVLVDEPGAGSRNEILRERVVEGFAPYFRRVGERASAAEQLAQFDSFRVLCVFRHGAGGVVQLNRLTEGALLRAEHIGKTQGWYAGRPVMVTRNDYTAMIFNGDIGITQCDGDDNHVVFDTAGGLRRYSTARLPDHETVYAMTVHKSQGSEFDSVLLVLPDQASDLLGRELIYTAVTRARGRVEIVGTEQVLRAAIVAGQARASGLRDRLRQPPSVHVTTAPEQSAWDF